MKIKVERRGGARLPSTKDASVHFRTNPTRTCSGRISMV